MEIQVIGLGVVGKAQAYLMQKLGHNVTGYDVKPVHSPYLKHIKITEAPVRTAERSLFRPLPQTGRHSVQPLATSTAQSVCK